VIELGKGNAIELAEKALKEFRAFAVIKADSTVLKSTNSSAAKN
jgi:transcription-repair coupling factor (superfamily II helicase)